MAISGVVIRSGPLDAERWHYRDLPRERWPDLLKVQRDYLAHTHLTLAADCRCMVSIIKEAEREERVWRALGFATVDEFIREGLRFDPHDARRAQDWLGIHDLEHPITAGLPRTFAVPDDAQAAVETLIKRFGRKAVEKAIKAVPLGHST